MSGEGSECTGQLAKAIHSKTFGMGGCECDQTNVRLEQVPADFHCRGLQVFFPVMLAAGGRVEGRVCWKCGLTGTQPKSPSSQPAPRAGAVLCIILGQVGVMTEELAVK